MPLFGRKPRPLPPPSQPLPDGELVERAVKATLLYAGRDIDGVLHMTNRRLVFEAHKGDAKWMLVPYADVRATGLYPAPGLAMGAPRSRRQCLMVQTEQGEQVWWDFGEREEREWLPLVQERVAAARSAAEEASAD